MTITVVESGMSFGPYPEEDCFQVEQSRLYARIKVGVPMVEFALIRSKSEKPTEIWLIEAKSSSPQPSSSTDFSEYIEAVQQKITNGLHVLFAVWLKRHEEAETELPVGFHAAHLRTAPIRCVLVIRGHPKAWLMPVQDALQKALRSVVQTMGLSASSVYVINDEKARQLRLIA